MLVKIFRHDPLCGESPHYDEFKLPDSVFKGATVMDVLDYISRKLDPSLGFFKHSRCKRGICKRCLLRVNGDVVLACNTVIDRFSPVILEPVNEKRVVKDLLVENL